MAIKTNTEKIIAQIGDEFIELTGEELKSFLELRESWKAEQDAAVKAKEKAEEDKAALLARLGLTEDELKIILG